MKTYYYLILIFLTLGIDANGQSKQEKEVAAAVEMFRKGILDANKNLLVTIAAEDLVYGHSSGVVQNKAEFIAQIINPKDVHYLSIDMADQTIKVSENVAIVRHIYSAETTNNGTHGHVKIGNMLILQKQHGKWKLLARQAYKI